MPAGEGPAQAELDLWDTTWTPTRDLSPCRSNPGDGDSNQETRGDRDDVRAHESGCAVELVETAVAEDDHAAKARMIRCMDEALTVARRAAPGVEIRVGAPRLPHPRGPL